MEAKNSLILVIKALQEIGKPINRNLFVNFIVGKETEELSESNLADLESYGSGDSHDEDFWSDLLDAALEGEYLRVRSIKQNTIEYTAKGRSFVRKPTSFIINDEEDAMPAVEAVESESDLDELMTSSLSDKKPSKEIASAKTKLQIKIIRAIDRKMALDDFAESENVALEEVLDEMELLFNQGRKLDIAYFTDEVIGADDMDELLEYFDAEGDDLDNALQEYGDVFNIEEIRLARFVWRSNK